MWKLKPWVETLARFVKTASLIVAAIGTAILFFVDIPALDEVPDAVVAIILGVSVVLILISDKVATDSHRLEIARMQLLLDEKRDLQSRIDHLASLRSKGVNELYATTPSVEEFAQYKDRYRDWQGEVEAYLKGKFPYALVEMFTDLGMIKTLKFEHASEDEAIAKPHTKILQMLAKQLTILERWIDEKSSLTLEIEPTHDDLLTQVDRESP